jgi:hypothetical protein
MQKYFIKQKVAGVSAFKIEFHIRNQTLYQSEKDSVGYYKLTDEKSNSTVIY